MAGEKEKMKPVYIKYFKEIHKGAEIDLVDVDDNTKLVTRVIVPEEKRGEGVGTELLNELTADADKECKTLLLEPRPYVDSGMTKRSLINYYKRFGFEYKGKDDYMERKPKSKKCKAIK